MDVMDAARNLAEDYPGGAKALALRIDKNPTTFSHELHGTGAAKLGLVDAVKASKRSDDARILNAFAEEMGCMVLQLPDALLVEGNVAMQDLGKLAKEFADVVQEVSLTCADDNVTANELGRVERQWGELLAAGQRVIAGLRAKHEAGKPDHLRVVGGQ